MHETKPKTSVPAYLVVSIDDATSDIKTVLIWSAKDRMLRRRFRDPTFVAATTYGATFMDAAIKLRKEMHDPQSRYHWLEPYYTAAFIYRLV